MTGETPFERELRSALHYVLDAQQGPHAQWAEAPAARKVTVRSARRPSQIFGLAASLVLGAALVAGGAMWLSSRMDRTPVVPASTPGPTAPASSVPAHSLTIPWDVRSGECSLQLSESAHPAQPASPPYVFTLQPNEFEIRGPVPSPLPVQPPLVQLDFTGDGWAQGGVQGRPFVHLTGPSQGFATLQLVNGFQGSLLLDSTGLWHAVIEGPGAGCRVDLNIVVEAPGT